MTESSHVDTAWRQAVTRSFLSEKPWSYLKTLVTGDLKLTKRFREGGFKLTVDNRDRAEKIILKEMFSSAHRVLLARLICEQLLHAKGMSQEAEEKLLVALGSRGEKPDRAKALSQKEFDTVAEALCPTDLAMLAAYASPCFSAPQLTTVMSDFVKGLATKDKNASAERIAELEERIADRDQRIKDFKKDLDEARSALKNQKSQDGKLKVEADGRRAEIEQLKSDYERKIESLRTQNSLLAEAFTAEEKAKEAVSRKLHQLERDSRGQQKTIRRQADKLQAQVEEIESLGSTGFADLILNDGVLSPDVIKCLNEPDEVKNLLESIVVAPEEDADLASASADLKQCWDRLREIESRLLKRVLDLGPQDLYSRSYRKMWADGSLKDEFNDAKYSLRARATLIDFLYEVIYRHFTRLSETGDGQTKTSK